MYIILPISIDFFSCEVYIMDVKILDLLQDPQKEVTKSLDARQTTTKSIDARQTESMDGRQTKSIRARAELAALGQPGRLARFTVKTGNNGQLTAVRRMENSNKDSNIQNVVRKYITRNTGSQSSRLTKYLIQRKANYMKQNCKRGYLSLIV